MAASKPTVMVNGLPGNMGLEVSAACLRRGFTVAGIALTGPGMAETVEVDDLEGGAKQTVRLLQVPPSTCSPRLPIHVQESHQIHSLAELLTLLRLRADL